MHVRSTVLILSLCILAACSRKPDKEDCARYARHLAEISGHPAVDAALRSQGGKAAVQQHCMGLKKAQVECSNESASLSDAASCETKKSSSVLDF
jgi:hypothetical protein